MLVGGEAMKKTMFDRLGPARKRGKFTKHDQKLARDIASWAGNFSESVSNNDVAQAEYDYFRLRKLELGGSR